MASLTAHARSIVDAFNNDDWDAARSLIGDSTYSELGTQRSLKGADAIIEALQGWKKAMPDVEGMVTNSFEGDQQVALEVSWVGTHTGEMVTEQGTIPPSGKRMTTPSAFLFSYQGDNLKESRNYFDLLTFLQQIGAA